MGRNSLDARQAVELVWRKLYTLGASAQGIVLTVPGYLQPAQAEILLRLGEHARLTVLGSMPTTLTAAMAGFAEQFWQNSVMVIDLDDHALTIGWVKAIAEKANLIESRSFPHLGARYWKDRLINNLADLFVWQHRRDPRDSPMAEQTLYDQLDTLLDAALQQRSMQIGVQSQQWFKHLLVHPEQTVSACQSMVRQVVQETEHLMQNWSGEAQPRGILLTHEAGRLPGLVEALSELVHTPPPPAHDNSPTTKPYATTAEEDFGDELLFHEHQVEELAGVLVLPPEAPARSAHGLADMFRSGVLPHGHLETMVPLPTPQPVENGPARLHFQSRDYLLRESLFTLGSQFGCHLCFDRHQHPDVAAKHCEILFEHRAFILYNRSREGTLVNDQPIVKSVILHAGDRIRLGYRGPVVRFLGRSLPRQTQVAFAPI